MKMTNARLSINTYKNWNFADDSFFKLQLITFTYTSLLFVKLTLYLILLTCLIHKPGALNLQDLKMTDQ